MRDFDYCIKFMGFFLSVQNLRAMVFTYLY